MPPADGVLGKSMFYTSVSGILYAGSSFLVILLATRWTSAYDAGILGLCLAVSQQLYTIGNFSSANFQASDASEHYSFQEYLTSRAITVSAMFPAAALWYFCTEAANEKALLLLPLLLQRASESFCTAFTARYQQMGRLDVGGRIELAKNVLSIAAFCLSLYISRSVLTAATASALTHISLFFVLDKSVLASFGKFKIGLPTVRVAELILKCLPLAAGTFMLYFLNTVVKSAIEEIMGPETLTTFNALFMAAFIIPLAANFILVPFVGTLGKLNNSGEYGKLLRFSAIQFAAVAAAGTAAIVLAGYCGTGILSLLFGLDLAPFAEELKCLVQSGILLALCQVVQTVVTVMRRQKWIPAAILPSVIYILAAIHPMVADKGIAGAADCFFNSTAILAASFAVLYFANFAFCRPRKRLADK